jgi:hypothetical protein
LVEAASLSAHRMVDSIASAESQKLATDLRR